MEVLIVVIVAILVIALATAVAPKLGIAGPLILLLVGAAVSVLPFVEIPEIDPEWILVGVLPPLLYSAAVSLPAIEFRRDFGPIAGLSFLLVIVSSIVLGLFFIAVIPGIQPAIAVALGAILSPTDAVATSIVKRLGVSRRVVTMLEGESLLNDATALVLLRTMIASVAVATTVAGDADVGRGVHPRLRVGRARRGRGRRDRRPAQPAPAGTHQELGREHGGRIRRALHRVHPDRGARRVGTRRGGRRRHRDRPGRGAVVLARAAPLGRAQLADDRTRARGRRLPASWASSSTRSSTQNIEDHNGLGTGLAIAAAALAILIAVRAAYVSLLVWLQSRRARGRQRSRLEAMSARIDEIASGDVLPAGSAAAATGQTVPTPTARRRRPATGIPSPSQPAR